MSAVTHACQTDGQTLLTVAACAGVEYCLGCWRTKQASGARRGAGILPLLLLLHDLEGHFNRLGDGRHARLIPDNSQAVLAQPLGHLLLGQAETLPLSPERVLVHCPYCN